MKKLLLFFAVGILAVACNPNEENPPITPPESEQPPQSPYLHIYHQNATPEGYENKHKHNGENHLYYDENYQGYTYPYQSGYDTFMVETNIQYSVEVSPKESWEWLKVTELKSENTTSGDVLVIEVTKNESDASRSATIQLLDSDTNVLSTLVIEQTDMNASPIVFEDQLVKKICIDNWDTNRDGELSYDEAATVMFSPSSIGSSPFYATEIRKFNEFKYFTGLNNTLNNTFAGCTNLEEITLPEHISTIAGVFRDCTSLKNVYLNESLAYIGYEAFRNCISLSDITLPQYAQIRKLAFCGCSSLKNITIPYSQNIEDFAFQDCTALERVTIEGYLHTIGYCAFWGCDNLKAILYKGCMSGGSITKISYYVPTISDTNGNVIVFEDGIKGSFPLNETMKIYVPIGGRKHLTWLRGYESTDKFTYDNENLRGAIHWQQYKGFIQETDSWDI
ncbi:MAG: leucine-rich repeat protein [Rikenellaceae bacterium]|nr:leucine-rich repeat protein [Rikenellaceae bacterium]